jgi:hypothetical protein
MQGILVVEAMRSESFLHTRIARDPLFAATQVQDSSTPFMNLYQSAIKTKSNQGELKELNGDYIFK